MRASCPHRACEGRAAAGHRLAPRFLQCFDSVVTVVGLYVGILVGNSVLTEIVFNRSGLANVCDAIVPALRAALAMQSHWPTAAARLAKS
jgi:hypothetical protein